MAKQIVYQFGRHNTRTDEFEQSSRLATEEYIARWNLVAIEGTQTEIDDADISGSVTNKGFC